MSERVRVLIPEEDLNARIDEVAQRINKDYEGKEVLLVGILKGAAMFMCELAKRLTMSVTFDFMSVSSYGRSTVSSGEVRILKDLDNTPEGKHVIIVEDIIDTGRTLNSLSEILAQRNVKSISICTLLNKPSRRVAKEVKVDYSCFEIPDAFVVGCGLDYDQKYRNLPYIGVVEFDEEGDNQ